MKNRQKAAMRHNVMIKLITICVVVAFIVSLNPIVKHVENAYAEDNPLSTVASTAQVVDMSLDYQTCVVLLSDGSLWTWNTQQDQNANYFGQLGDGTTEPRYEPKKIMDDVKNFSFSGLTCAAVKTDGSLWTWGSDSNGQLGDGEDSCEPSLAPKKIADNISSVYLGGFDQAAAIKNDSTLLVWGRGLDGEIGDGSFENRFAPTPVMSDVQSVSIGANSFITALKKNGDLYTWGDNWEGQLGTGSDEFMIGTPTKILDNVKSMFVDRGFGNAIKNDNSLWCWGDGDGIIGDGTANVKKRPEKIFDNVDQIAYGNDVGMLIKKDGTLWSWQRDEFGDNIPVYVANNVTYAYPYGINGVVLNESDYECDFAYIKSGGILYGWLATSEDDDETPNEWQLGTQVKEVHEWPSGENGSCAIIKTDGSLWVGISCRDLKKIEFEGSAIVEPSPEEPIENYKASDPMAQLAACELTQFNPNDRFIHTNVASFIKSDYFNDGKIWGNENSLYSDFFINTIGNYIIIDITENGANKHITIQDPSTDDIIIALDPQGASTYIDAAKSITTSETSESFNSAVEACDLIAQEFPGQNIYLTGAYLGGITAAYVGTAANYPVNVFNGFAGYGAKLAWLTQGEFIDPNSFTSINAPSCVNYYNAEYPSYFGNGSDVVATEAVTPNKDGNKNKLNSLYENDEDKYVLRPHQSSKPKNEMKTFPMLKVKDSFESIKRTVNNMTSLKPDISFEDDAKAYSELTLGTDSSDKRSLPLHQTHAQIVYTGSGADDRFGGGHGADIFVAGKGKSKLYGNEGSDTYIISSDANVEIEDSGSLNGNAICDGTIGIIETLCGLIAKSESVTSTGLENTLDALESIIKDTNQDRIIFRDCPFSSMTVERAGNGGLWSDYIIHAGRSTVTIDARSPFQSDYLLIDASNSDGSGRVTTKNLKDFFAEKLGRSNVANNELDVAAATQTDNLVGISLTGNDVVIEVNDRETGASLATCSTSEDNKYIGDYGTFYCDKSCKMINGNYDSSKLEVKIANGTVDHMYTNYVPNDFTKDVAHYNDLRIYPNDPISIEIENNVQLTTNNSEGSKETLDPEIISPEYETLVDYVDIYRLYNKWSGEHLFTPNLEEYNARGSEGWQQEGVAWQAPTTGDTVYRLYNPYSGDHHYTTSKNEYDSLGAGGWNQEGEAWKSAGTDGMPVYRLYNQYVAIGTHHYTTNKTEFDALPDSGWKQEGIGWYGIK